LHRPLANAIKLSPSEAPAQTTRERIVAAAYRVLSEQGSHATSIKEIAKAAGVAPGLVHYYFTSKEQLLLEVTRDCCRLYREEMSALVLPDDPIARTRALLDFSKRRGLASPDWYRLLVDLDALALRDDALAREVAALRREIREHVASLVADVEDALALRLGPTRDALAAVLMTSVDGLIVQRLIDPTFDIDAGFVAVEQLLIALLEQATRNHPGSNQ
jgi:AcrR family transcriptional regulator